MVVDQSSATIPPVSPLFAFHAHLYILIQLIKGMVMPRVFCVV